MPAHRFFLDDPLSHALVELSGEEFHHLKNVMRARGGDALELVNGKGTLCRARVGQMRPTFATVEIIYKIDEPLPSRSLILAQALTRPACLDWIVEKSTELGAAEIWLFPGDQSEKKEISSHSLQRLEKIVLSALKQCGRLYLPKLELKPALSRWQKPRGTLLYGSLSARAQPLLSQHGSPLIMVIGPEKGFSPAEHTTLESQLDALPVTLHRNTLRAETAALCALSLLSHQLLLDENIKKY